MLSLESMNGVAMIPALLLTNVYLLSVQGCHEVKTSKGSGCKQNESTKQIRGRKSFFLLSN